MTIPPLQLITNSLTIFHLTDINTIVLNDNGSIQLLHEHDYIPEFMSDLQEEDFLFLSEQVRKFPGLCCIYTNEWGFTYLARTFEIEGESTKILINGPFLMQVPEMSRLDSKFKMDQQKRIELEGFYRGLKLMSGAKVQSVTNILDKIDTISEAEHRELERPQQPSPQYPFQKNAAFLLKQPDEASIDLIELRYKIEQEMMQAVQHGDIKLLMQIRSRTKTLFDFSERFPNRPIRSLRNALIILNTLFRVAAKNAKVEPIFLHQISEKFAKQIERSETIESLNKLSSVMFNEYCELVRQRAVNGYSPLVQKAIQYVAVHSSKPMNLEELAKACHAHPAHLSRQFKKETGITLTHFHQKQRIEEAKALLKAGDSPIKRIAEYVGFDDAAYFTRVFKKLEGMTPSEFQKTS